MYVLMHYYNHFEGEIRFGSQSISDIQKKELYRSIALIHQNVVVLDGTLRDNVSLYESYSDENIKQALIRAGMGDYLNEKGLDFTIQESGSNPLRRRKTAHCHSQGIPPQYSCHDLRRSDIQS